MTPTADEIAAEIKVLVKPLEWRDAGHKSIARVALLDDDARPGDETYYMVEGAFWWLHPSWSGPHCIGSWLGDLAPAKEAAQADYERRILSALNPDVLAAYEAQRAEIAALKRERDDTKAHLTARAKEMLRARDRLVLVRDGVEDEGDRVYFGSTNDADDFMEIVQAFDDWAWDDIVRDASDPDVFEQCRAANERANKAEAEIAARDALIAEAREAVDRSKGAFEAIRLHLVNNLREPERSAFWIAVSNRDVLDALLTKLSPPAPTKENADG